MESENCQKGRRPLRFFQSAASTILLFSKKELRDQKSLEWISHFFPRKVDVLMLTLHSTTAGTGLAAFGLRIPEVRPVGRGAVAD